jgi:hypothetical protein
MHGTVRSAKWVLALAAVALIGAAAWAYRDASRIHAIMANGTETTALVEGGTAGVRQVDDDSYVVELAWQDSSGALHTEKGVAVVAALGRQLVAGEAGDPPALLIKYAPDAPGRRPVIVRLAALDQEANARTITSSAVAAALCALGAAVLAWLGRRRQGS